MAWFRPVILSDDEVRAEMESAIKDLETQRLRTILARVAAGGTDQTTELSLLAQSISYAEQYAAWRRQRDAETRAALKSR